MYKAIRPFLFRMDPEKAHQLAIRTGEYLSDSWLGERIGHLYDFDDEILHTAAFSMEFENPIGLAAGFDNGAQIVDFLPNVGFGLIEVGSVTAEPSNGNPKPRIFRLTEDEALINRMGLNNDGPRRVRERLSKRKTTIPVGVNIAKTNNPQIMGDSAIRDFCYSFEVLYPVSDYMVINISCPNSGDGKTFEDRSALGELLSAIKGTDAYPAYEIPVLIKISPDLSHEGVDDIIEVAEEHSIDGYVIGNTSSRTVDKIGSVGLSGAPIRERSTQLVRYVYRHLDSPFIIGCGGISSAKHAYEKIKSGASLLQLFTGLVYEGPGLPKRIKRELARLLRDDGFSSVTKAVGVDAVYHL